MVKELMLDEVFHIFVNRLEKDYLEGGAFCVRTELDLFSVQEIDDLIWEIEEKFEQTIDRFDLLASFYEALDYIEEVYSINARADQEQSSWDILEA